MATTNQYDLIIIGTGAGGGALAYHLAPSGKRILLLERGDYLRRERDNWDSLAVFVQARYRAQETWYDRDDKPFHPGIQYFVGGNTKVYGAALFRLRPATSERSSITAACRRPGRSATMTSSPTIPRRSSCFRSTATTAKTRRKAPGASSTPTPR